MRLPDGLQPFSLSVRCPKCHQGNDDWYKLAYRARRWTMDILCDLSEKCKGEHLHVWCYHCGYSWVMECADSEVRHEAAEGVEGTPSDA